MRAGHLQFEEEVKIDLKAFLKIISGSYTIATLNRPGISQLPYIE